MSSLPYRTQMCFWMKIKSENKWCNFLKLGTKNLFLLLRWLSQTWKKNYRLFYVLFAKMGMSREPPLHQWLKSETFHTICLFIIRIFVSSTKRDTGLTPALNDRGYRFRNEGLIWIKRFEWACQNEPTFKHNTRYFFLLLSSKMAQKSAPTAIILPLFQQILLDEMPENKGK